MRTKFKLPKALNYKGNTSNWYKFKQQFDIYMKAADLVNNDSENKVNIFLNIGGEEALEIYNNLNLTPDEKKDYDLVIEAFENFCVSKQNVIYKSFKFFTRVQQSGELFSDFYNDLQFMAEFCNFGDQKERLIRDRIIAGIRNPALQDRFLKAPDLSLNEVVLECSEDEVERIQNNQQFKREFRVEDSEEEVDDDDGSQEGDNTYQELLNVEQDQSYEDESALEQIHVPSEVLFNDMALQEGENRDDHKNGEENEISMEEIEEPEEEREEEVELDIKPRVKPRLCKVEAKDNIVQNSRSNRKGKVSEKKKKAETIQMKIAEIKKKLCNDIKKEVDCEQKGIHQKFTRSRVRPLVEVKKEPIEAIYVEHAETGIGEEEPDPYNPYDYANDPDYEDSAANCKPVVYQTSTDDERNEVETQDDHIENREFHTLYLESENREDTQLENEDTFSDNEGEDTQLENEDAQLENDDTQQENDDTHSENEDTRPKNRIRKLEPLNQMVAAEYMAEYETKILKSYERKRRKKAAGPRKNDVKIIKLQRQDLPPLILKKVNKKMLLLGKMPYPCQKCDSSFWTAMQLERHQLVHVLKKVQPPSSSSFKRVFKCGVCAKEFKKICDLERHTRVHTGEKPSVCNICNKRFQQAYNLNKHLLIHTKEKSYECVICQKKFGRIDVLNRHVLTHSIDKPFACTLCSKTFIRNTQLNLHLRKHHGMNKAAADAATPAQEAVDDPAAVNAQNE